MTWLALKSMLGGVLKFLRGIPWPIYAFLAVVMAFWWYGEHKEAGGKAAARAECKAAQYEASRLAVAAQLKRDRKALQANTVAAQEGAKASTETRTETAKAVERVTHETRALVTTGCPSLPKPVVSEGRAAVDRARAAGG